MLFRSDVIGVVGKAGNSSDAAPDLDPHPDPLPGPVPARRSLSDISALHSQILARLGPSPMAEDQLIRDLAMSSAAIAPELIALELEGRIERQAGGLISRLD